jgi:hypothetical protein
VISPLPHDSWPVDHLYRKSGKNKAHLFKSGYGLLRHNDKAFQLTLPSQSATFGVQALLQLLSRAPNDNHQGDVIKLGRVAHKFVNLRHQSILHLLS